MASSKAQISKEKGNAAFKKGDYANAIGFYTSAMMDNPSEPTYALNRAAAYLKLGKNEDAERDCTNVLKISPKNSKAYFRRGQAKMAMEKLSDAQKDFSEAYELEPNNPSVLSACAEVSDRLEAKREEVMAAKAARKFVDPNFRPKRRRVPIKIVEPPSLPSKAPPMQLPKAASTGATPTSPVDSLKEVSSRPLAPSSHPSAAPSRPEQVQPSPSTTTPVGPAPVTTPAPSSTSSKADERPSFKEAKQARDTARPTRVGGGIFRASGESTIFPTKETTSGGASPTPQEPLENTPTPTSSKGEPLKAPSNLFDLVKEWNARKTPEERWKLLSTIQPAKFPSLCKTSLEPEFLASVLATFVVVLGTADLETQISVKSYMDFMPDVQRFNTIFMFLSKKEKELAREVWKMLGVEKPEGPWSSLLK